jgi:pimeloyl-ACP methyl ester carboxylesterase
MVDRAASELSASGHRMQPHPAARRRGAGRTARRRALLLGAVGAVAIGGSAPGAWAKPVSIAYRGLKLIANLETAAGHALGDGAVLIVHGTMAHARMETIATLQKALKARGLGSLAITLSLGESDRKGMFPCDHVQRHKHTDALPEIAAWYRWLEARGAGKVALLGHSRGGNQVVRYALAQPAGRVAAVVALAPMTWTAASADRRYRRRYHRDRRTDVAAARRRGHAILANHPFLHCPSTRVAADSFVSYYADDLKNDTPTLLAGVRVPTLVIVGSADKVVTDLPARMKRVTNPEVKFVVIDGSGHFFLDLFADDAADRIAAFLKPILAR